MIPLLLLLATFCNTRAEAVMGCGSLSLDAYDVNGDAKLNATEYLSAVQAQLVLLTGGSAGCNSSNRPTVLHVLPNSTSAWRRSFEEAACLCPNTTAAPAVIAAASDKNTTTTATGDSGSSSSCCRPTISLSQNYNVSSAVCDVIQNVIAEQCGGDGDATTAPPSRPSASPTGYSVKLLEPTRAVDTTLAPTASPSMPTTTATPSIITPAPSPPPPVVVQQEEAPMNTTSIAPAAAPNNATTVGSDTSNGDGKFESPETGGAMATAAPNNNATTTTVGSDIGNYDGGTTASPETGGAAAAVNNNSNTSTSFLHIGVPIAAVSVLLSVVGVFWYDRRQHNKKRRGTATPPNKPANISFRREDFFFVDHHTDNNSCTSQEGDFMERGAVFSTDSTSKSPMQQQQQQSREGCGPTTTQVIGNSHRMKDLLQTLHLDDPLPECPEPTHPLTKKQSRSHLQHQQRKTRTPFNSAMSVASSLSADAVFDDDDASSINTDTTPVMRNYKSSAAMARTLMMANSRNNTFAAAATATTTAQTSSQQDLMVTVSQKKTGEEDKGSSSQPDGTESSSANNDPDSGLELEDQPSGEEPSSSSGNEHSESFRTEQVDI